jgi:hypothetical protein
MFTETMRGTKTKLRHPAIIDNTGFSNPYLQEDNVTLLKEQRLKMSHKIRDKNKNYVAGAYICAFNDAVSSSDNTASND